MEFPLTPQVIAMHGQRDAIRAEVLDLERALYTKVFQDLPRVQRLEHFRKMVEKGDEEIRYTKAIDNLP